MRPLTLLCGLALAVALGCAKKQPMADSHQSAYVQLLNFQCGDRWSRTCSASQRRQAVALCRRAVAEVDRPPSTTVDRAGRLESIAERAQVLRLPRSEVLYYARRAFDHSLANGRLFWADHAFHKYRIEDETRHRNLVLRAYAGLEYGYTMYSSLATDADFKNRHPLDSLSAQHAYELAMEHRVFDAAEIVAQRFRLSERHYLEARRAKFAKQFEEDVAREANTAALHTAENSDARIPRDRVLEVARRSYEVHLNNGAPFEAHKIAAKYNLGESYLRRALDAAFADAVSRGTYQLARRLPGGEFLIISPPR